MAQNFALNLRGNVREDNRIQTKRIQKFLTREDLIDIFKNDGTK